MSHLKTRSTVAPFILTAICTLGLYNGCNREELDGIVVSKPVLYYSHDIMTTTAKDNLNLTLKLSDGTIDDIVYFVERNPNQPTSGKLQYLANEIKVGDTVAILQGNHHRYDGVYPKIVKHKVSP